MEHTTWKLPSGTYTMEGTSWRSHNRSFLMERIPWKLPSVRYTMEVTSWNLHRGRFLMEHTPSYNDDNSKNLPPVGLNSYYVQSIHQIENAGLKLVSLSTLVSLIT